MIAIKSTILKLFFGLVIVSCFESKLIEKATDTANETFDYKGITCVVWWRTDTKDVNRLLEGFHGSVVTFSMQEPTKKTFHRIVKYKQTILFARDLEEFRHFLYLVVRHVMNPISVILILTEPVINNNVLTNMMKLAWENDVGDFIILSIGGNNDVTLTTYIPYRDGVCGNYSPMILTDNDNKYFIRKFNNFKSCPVRVTAVHTVLYFVLETNEGKVVHASGIDGDILSLVIERLNATINFIDGIDNNDIGAFINGSGSGSFGELVNGSADIMGPSLLLNAKRHSVAQPSYVYQTLNLVWCLPRRREIYTWFKVLLPLFTGTTLLLILAFVSLIVLIMLIHHYGRVNPKLKNVTFLILSMFIGQPVKFLTKNWLVNSVFVLWIWFCLIIRVVYQSDLVESFELTIFEPRLSTVSEALEVVDGHGGFPTVKDYFRNTSIEINYQSIRLNDTANYINMVANGKRFLLVTNELLIKYFNSSVQILDERVTSIPTCFYMRPRWPAINEVDKIIERITETGFVTKIISDYIKNRSVKRSLTQTKIPKPLEMSVLIACFNGLIIMYFVCSIVLAFEIYCYKIKRRN